MENVQRFSYAMDMEDRPRITVKLKDLRTRAGLTMKEMAKLLGYKGASSYQAYETTYKRDTLPLPLAQKLLPLVGQGKPPITSRDIYELVGGLEIKPDIFRVYENRPKEKYDRLYEIRHPFETPLVEASANKYFINDIARYIDAYIAERIDDKEAETVIDRVIFFMIVAALFHEFAQEADQFGTFPTTLAEARERFDAVSPPWSELNRATRLMVRAAPRSRLYGEHVFMR